MSSPFLFLRNGIELNKTYRQLSFDEMFLHRLICVLDCWDFILSPVCKTICFFDLDLSTVLQFEHGACATVLAPFKSCNDRVLASLKWQNHCLVIPG
jgi:hypothetical protein